MFEINSYNSSKYIYLDNNSNCIIKIIIIFIFSFSIYLWLNEIREQYKNQSQFFRNNNALIKENFFVIDSNNLHSIIPHMYGFTISKKGILTDNYYKQLGEYEQPLPQGIYVMIRKIGDEIILNQDFYGSFGLYMYENKDENYFAISNSFLLLVEFLVEKKKKISLNKDFSDHLIVTNLVSFSLDETLIKEIKMVESNAYIIINLTTKTFKIFNQDYNENTIPLESEEGLNIIDKWADKWCYILRSLKKQTDNISVDISGGFDSRATLAVLLNSGINMDEIRIRSSLDKKNDHDSDFKIASNISSKLGFKLNNNLLDENYTGWNTMDSIFNEIYSKLGFHKQFYIRDRFYNKPRFCFTGSGGEFIRGKPNLPIKKFIELISIKNIQGHREEFYNSSEKLLNRSISFLKKKKKFNNDFEIAFELNSRTEVRNHNGRSAAECFMANIYNIQPLMDPEIRKIKYEISNKTSHDLIAYLYVRFCKELVTFPFQGNRTLNYKSIKKAIKLNNNFKPYERKSDYNDNFFIDKKKESPVIGASNKNRVYEYLKKFFQSTKYFNLIKKIYDKNVFNWANEYIGKTNFHPLSQHYALLAISKIYLNCLSLKHKLLNV